MTSAAVFYLLVNNSLWIIIDMLFLYVSSAPCIDTFLYFFYFLK